MQPPSGITLSPFRRSSAKRATPTGSDELGVIVGPPWLTGMIILKIGCNLLCFKEVALLVQGAHMITLKVVGVVQGAHVIILKLVSNLFGFSGFCGLFKVITLVWRGAIGWDIFPENPFPRSLSAWLAGVVAASRSDMGVEPCTSQGRWCDAGLLAGLVDLVGPDGTLRE